MKKFILSIVILLFTDNLSADISFTDFDIGNRNPITSPVDGYDKDSNSYVNPFADDEIQFQINAANFNDYLSYLTN